MSLDNSYLDTFPSQCGVYLMKDKNEKIIYVGKAKNIKARLKQYFLPGGDERAMVPFLTQQVVLIDTIVLPTEREALLLENTLIKKHQPKFNAILKDDKTFISLTLNIQHKWPMLKLVRYKGKPLAGHLYFGPYTSAYAARKTFDLLSQIFPLRQCSDQELKKRKRPCLLYSIKRCIAPCVDLCSKQEYDQLVNGLIDFLRGKDKEIVKTLHQKMQEAADALQFEVAATYLNTLRQVEHVISKDPLLVRAAGKECDVLGLYRHRDEVVLLQLIFRENQMVGSEYFTFSSVAENDEELLTTFLMQHYNNSSHTPKEVLIPFSLSYLKSIQEILKNIHLIIPQKGDKKALIDLAHTNAAITFQQKQTFKQQNETLLLDLEELCALTRYPKRIECFDTSHIAGTSPVACMVAFTEGMKDKKRTRLFHIKNEAKGDDYGAMRQVLLRRLIKAKEEDDLPDLIILDGGKGHLHLGMEIFKELDIASVDLISIAKERGRHDKGMTQEQLFLPHRSTPILLDPSSKLLFLLQQIRDEAHQTALSFHRKTRKKRVVTSALDTIEGIGPVKRNRLLKQFGSVAKIKTASEEALLQVKGISKKDVEALKKLL